MKNVKIPKRKEGYQYGYVVGKEVESACGGGVTRMTYIKTPDGFDWSHGKPDNMVVLPKKDAKKLMATMPRRVRTSYYLKRMEYTGKDKPHNYYGDISNNGYADMYYLGYGEGDMNEHVSFDKIMGETMCDYLDDSGAIFGQFCIGADKKYYIQASYNEIYLLDDVICGAWLQECDSGEYLVIGIMRKGNEYRFNATSFIVSRDDIIQHYRSYPKFKRHIIENYDFITKT